MNEDISQKLDMLIAAVQEVAAKVDAHDQQLQELDSVIYDGLIGPANEALAQNEYDNALSDFRAKYAEKLGPYESITKAVEGEDFDVYKAAFDGYNDGDYDVSVDEYIDKVTESLTAQIQTIKEVVAEVEDVKPEDVHVEVEGTNENGEPQVEVEIESEKDHNEEMETKAEEGETKEELDNRVEAEVNHNDETPAETKDDDDGEETLEEFEASLKEEADKDKEHSWIRG